MKFVIHTWMGSVIAGFVIGIGVANAAVISPTNSVAGVASPPTLSIIDPATGADLTESWLPEPGQPMVLRVIPNEITGIVTSLDAQGTTNYPGVCTNYGVTASPEPEDFNYDAATSRLTPQDCGGSARVRVDGRTSSGTVVTFFYTLPVDSNGDGLPDIWVNNIARNPGLTPGEDLEINPSVDGTAVPANDPQRGDGFSALDEYRGFIVGQSDRTASPCNPLQPAVPCGTTFTGLPNTKHIRTSPTQKDIFVHVVTDLASGLVTGGCEPATPPRGMFKTYFAGADDLFAAAYTLVPGIQIHLLDYIDFVGNVSIPKKSPLWNDFFETYSVNLVTLPSGTQTKGVLFVDSSNTLTDIEPLTDRQLNGNALLPITDRATNQPIQKGIRLIQCSSSDSLSTLGLNNWGTPNRAGSGGSNAGNAITFTERIRKDIANKITAAGSRTLQYSVTTGTSGGWSSVALVPVQPTKEDFLVKLDLQYVIGHEVAHGTRLTPSSTNGYHTIDTASMMDQSIKTTSDKSTSGKYTFYIPKLFLTPDQQKFALTNQ